MKRDLALGCHSCHTTARNDFRRRFFAAANVLQECRASLPGAIEHVHGPRKVRTGPDELVVLSIGRDATPWIDTLIEHHLALGAKHVFFLDNASRDDTVERAVRHPHVSVFRTSLAFRRYEVGLRRWMIRNFGRNRWSLYCDADELFDYPCSDRLPLSGLLSYLSGRGYTAVTGQMLDLFSQRSFGELTKCVDVDLKREYRYYDLADLVPTRDVYWIRDGHLDHPDMPCLFGGIRKRFFGDDCLLLTKHPLVFADRNTGVYRYDGHFASGARVADISTVLLHYKYVGSLPQRVRTTVDEQWHNEVEALYGGLASALANDPDLCLCTPTSREYQAVDELVANGFLSVSDRYLEHVERSAAMRRVA